jgi:crotonobetainyl-CoA:carnitine CoA-transferase CaiB-like acyl-CoA transferase
MNHSSNSLTVAQTPTNIEGERAWTATGSSGALSGIRVLDLSRVLAGPYATQMLADHGASVLKVESPDGDETRAWGPPFVREGTSAYYEGLNRSKDNMCLNLRTEEGREVLWHLIAGADVLVENFKSGTMAKWGFDFETRLRPKFPDLVYCSVTGFGSGGPLGGEPGYDAVLQSFGGLMSVNGYADGLPLRVGVPIVDITAGNLAFSGILLALLERERRGEGQLVDITLLDAVASLLHPHSSNWIHGGQTPQRTGDTHPSVVPYQIFTAADGDLFISAANDRQFTKLMTLLEAPELATDELYATNSARSENRDSLIQLLSKLISKWDRTVLSERLTEVGVASSPVNTVDQALSSAQAIHRGLIIDNEDYKGVGVPIKLQRTPGPRPRRVQDRGESTLQVLGAMGYDHAAVQRLKYAGALG